MNTKRLNGNVPYPLMYEKRKNAVYFLPSIDVKDEIGNSQIKDFVHVLSRK